MPAMFELILSAPEALVESVSDALMDELGALSVSVEDADADTDAENALFGEPGMPAPAAGWARSNLKALFDNETTATEAMTLLLAQDWTAGVAARSLDVVADQDWVRVTQSQFSPVEITPIFWIVPSWHEPPADARRIIRLDPGLAFGTGTHPTTRMCLRWIATHEQELLGTKVLDYGCGSGILAIGAALHGAADVDAVDIDPAAVESTAQNAVANDVKVRAGTAELVDPPEGRYDIVLANILATPLKLLAPLLTRHLKPGGQIVLAGILNRQADELRAAYAPWCAIDVLDGEDGWILMGGRRPA